ncbi:hypothetical protein chiPu_0007697 [Chiloscyllium punctatum]|uniref:Protein kinase domain-containing protein n=1 Tax=Chiloscyllium punctatum TaxID=137246 RepID=A0A401SFS7_CHIPU|nr:hypothetical protein [Chiloscyllium punctatum]
MVPYSEESIENVADFTLKNTEAGTRKTTEVHIPSLEHDIQRSKADIRHALQEHLPECTSEIMYKKSKRKSVTFSDFGLNNEEGASPSSAEYNVNSFERKADEGNDKPYHSTKESTTSPSEPEESRQVSTRYEGSEMEKTFKKLEDSPLFYMAVPQDSTKMTAIPEHIGLQMKPHKIDKSFKPDSSDSQTQNVKGHARPIQDLENENIQSVTVKKLREIQFSPTTFKRKTFAARINVTEQNIFSRISSEGVNNREEEMSMLPEIKRHLYMEHPKSYHVHLASQDNSGILEVQGAEPSDTQEISTSQQFLSLTPTVVKTRTETEVKEECSMKPTGRRKLHSNYDVKEEVGRGSHGFVKRVVNKQNGTSCAAKFIPLRKDTRSQAYEELAILSKVNHPKISCLLDMFETKRTLVLVLEMCSNEGLLDHLFKRNVVPETEIKYYIQQILEGVQYLHDNKILHLDIKPANILMVHPERNDIKICDFGFAQKFEPVQPQFSKYGCPEFVAPEIVSQDPISTATDIWAVGVITFLCLTGSSPFIGENDRATLMNVKEGSFSWDERDQDCISEDAQNFITRIIRIIPQDRPTASECLEEQWFQVKQKLQESCTINTKKLKFFISRSKWQQSLISYKSILVMRSIPELLEGTSDGLSLGMSRHLLKESSSPTTSASSSDFEDCTHQTDAHSTHTPEVNQTALDQYFTNESEFYEIPWSASFSKDITDPDICKEKFNRTLLTRNTAVEEQPYVKHEAGAEYREDMKAQHKYSEICEDLNLNGSSLKHPLSKAASVETSDCSRVEGATTHILVQGISSDNAVPLQLSGQSSSLDTSSKSSPRLLPRHCLIKSTFCSDMLESRDLSTENAQYTRSLESTRRRFVEAGYTRGKVSGLRQPLLECFQIPLQSRRFDAERVEEISSHSSGRLTRSASYDNSNIVAHPSKENSRKTKSFDEYEGEFLAQTIVNKPISEIPELSPEQLDPNSNTMLIVSDVLTPQPISLDAEESGTQESAMCDYTCSDTVCLSEEGSFLSNVKYSSESPVKNISFEIDQSVQTDVASLHSSEKNMEMHMEKKACIIDSKVNGSQYSEMEFSVAVSSQSPSDLQTMDSKSLQSLKETKTSSLSESPELESTTSQRQHIDQPASSHSDVSGMKSFDFQCPMDSELQSEISSVAASIVTSDQQEQSSNENISSLYFNTVEPGTDYFDLSEPYSYGLEFEHCPSFLSERSAEKSTWQAESMPVPWTSEELFPSKETKAKKGSPLQGKSDQASSTSYEILCDEAETTSKYSWNLTANESESDLLELLKDTEEDETASDIEERESKIKRRSKRASLENVIHQSFESLRKAFKSQKDAKPPTASSETISEIHTDPLPKSTSEMFGSSSLLRLFRRSASLNWDKGLHHLDEDGRENRYSLSVLRDLNVSKQLPMSVGTRKSQTLPARFSLQLKSKEKPKMREKKDGKVIESQARADPNNEDLSGNQYMEVMKMPLIPLLTSYDENIEKQQGTVQSTDTRNNTSSVLKKKSKLFSLKLPGSKAKEKAPSFLEGLMDQSVVLSQSVTLSCRSQGYPNPDIRWFKEDQLVCCSNRIQTSTTSKSCQLLTILNVIEDDLGRYTCVAENHLGKASTCCLLNLAVVPCRPDSPEVAQVYEDGVLVIWKPLVANTPIMYIIECKRKGEDWTNVASNLSESCFYASDLCKGETYSYRIAYINKAGKGQFSQPSSEVIIGKTAPEILEGKAVVPETDIWAVGVLTFTMLSADCPFRSDKDCDKEKNVRKGKVKLGRCYAGLSQGAVLFLKNTLC